MRFLRTRSSLNYKADFQNHLSYLPPIEVLKQAFTSTDEKGKAPTVIDEGIRPLDGQFRKVASYSTNDDSATHDSAANTSAKQIPQLMTRARHLLLLMKAFVLWMVSFAKLHLSPPMMTLPLMTLLPMHPSQILKPQLLG